jgi:hypothetical protein
MSDIVEVASYMAKQLWKEAERGNVLNPYGTSIPDTLASCSAEITRLRAQLARVEAKSIERLIRDNIDLCFASSLPQTPSSRT